MYVGCWHKPSCLWDAEVCHHSFDAPLYIPQFFLLRIESKQNSVNIIFSQRLNYDVKMGKKTSLTINQGLGRGPGPAFESKVNRIYI